MTRAPTNLKAAAAAAHWVEPRAVMVGRIIETDSDHHGVHLELRVMPWKVGGISHYPCSVQGCQLANRKQVKKFYADHPEKETR